MSEHPNDWISCLLGERVQFQYGKSPNEVRSSKGTYPVYGSSGKTSEAVDFTTDSPSIIVGRKGTIDKPIFLEERCWAIDTTYFIDTFPHDHPKYLFYLLDSINLKSLNESTGVPSLSRDALHAIAVSLPPLPEQKKIAEILSGIDKLIIKKEKQICILENLEKSVLDALTDQELRAGTRCAPLSEIVSPDRKITYGIVQAGPNIKDGIPYIRVTDMSDEELDVNKMLRTSPEIAEKFKRSEVQEGDIVVALRGIIGATHLIDDRTSGANLTQGTALLSKSDKCLPLYVNTILKSQFCREQFSLLSKGSTIVEITLSSLATLTIPLPNISTQERIANSIASIKRQKSSNRKSLASIRSMKNAIASDLLSGRKRVSV